MDELADEPAEDLVLPNKARGFVTEVLIRDKNDKFTEWHVYCWVGRENRCLYKVHVINPDGSYDKHKKDLDSILASIRTAKLPKK